MNSWTGDWEKRIYSHLRDQGFDTMTAFAEAMPQLSMSELACRLGPHVNAVQVEAILKAEAMATGSMDRCARSLLVRRLRELIPNGWNIGTHYDFPFRRASAYAMWSAAFDDAHQGAADRAWNALRSSEVPDGWLPEGPDDPIIERAFAGVQFDAPDEA